MIRLVETQLHIGTQEVILGDIGSRLLCQKMSEASPSVNLDMKIKEGESNTRTNTNGLSVLSKLDTH